MNRVFVLLALLAGLVLFSFSVAASDLPAVKQPSDPSLSAADRAALSAAWTAVEALLKPDYQLARMVQLSGRQWADAEFAQFTAGVLQSAGYTALLATGSWSSGTTRTWILVGIPASQGVAYFPVEAAPSMLVSSRSIGQIAWQGGASGTTYDTRYLSFAGATALDPNAPPAVSVGVAESYAVVEETTTLLVTGSDPDDAMLFFDWTFSDGTKIADPRATLWYTFHDTGKTTILVSAYDVRGAHTDLTLDVNVLATRPDCGCHH
jgi:hypothetical protein